MQHVHQDVSQSGKREGVGCGMRCSVCADVWYTMCRGLHRYNQRLYENNTIPRHDVRGMNNHRLQMKQCQLFHNPTAKGVASVRSDPSRGKAL